MASPAASAAAAPIIFDLTLNQAHSDSLQWIAQQQQQQAAENEVEKDPRSPTSVPPVYLPSPVIRFVVPDANSVRSSVEQFCDDQHLTKRQRASMLTLTHAMGMQIAEEKMTHIYYQLLLAEKRMNSISGSVSLSLVSNNRQLSDGIGHYDDDDTNESLNANGDSSIQSTAQAPTALSKWKQLARVPVVPHKIDPTSLSALLSALLSTVVGKPTHGPADSPLAKLYHLACVYHTEHLIYLQKKQAAYTQLRNEQSKEMEIICQQAQQSEIDAASMGMEDASSTGTNSSSIVSTANSTGSASALSDAISSLVQSHLHSSSVLEDEWEHRVENWCRIARRKFAIYVKDTWEEYMDRLERTKSAQAAHDRLAAEKVRQSVEKKRNKILQTEQEELEESARVEKEQAISAQKDVAAQIKVFTSAGALLQEHASANMSVPPSTWGSNLLGLDELQSTKPEENKSATMSNSSSLNALPSPAGSPSPNSSSSAASTAATAAPPPQFASSASTPELSTAPFPFQSLLGTTSVFLGGVNSSNLFQLFLSNDPLFIASSERVGATNTSASGPAASPNSANASAASGNAANSASVPISSSPLISFAHYSAHLDALFGCRGKGGLSAMLLPHHLSPLLHATHANPHRDQLQSSATTDANDALDETKLDSQASKLRASPLYFAASRRLREHAMHYFNISNLYVKNWLQYARNHNDLLCEEFGVQMERMEKKLKEIADKKNQAAATNASFPNLHQASSNGSAAVVAQPATSAATNTPLVSPGDIIVTRHSHVLNAQLCFHINVLPRRGGPATAGGTSAGTPSEELSAGSSPAGVGRMSEEEVKQQQYLFTTVLPHLFNVACEYNVHTLSVPLIWDNILLSMWTISGNYVGFGWKDADASNLSNTTSAASNIRSEELAVYECMVRYIESHLRAIKFCLGQLPKNCPLKQIVFYLPASATQNTLLYNIDQTNTNVSNLIGENMDIGSGGKDGVDAHAANHPTINAHPFLAKCKLLFREVFQA